MLRKSGCIIILLSIILVGFSKESFCGPFGYYPTHSEIDSVLDDLSQRYPNIFKRDILGTKTIENRDIFYVKISNSPDEDNKKPEALITGAQHSCEVIGPACVRLDMNHLCENYDTDPEVKWLVDNRQIYFVPIYNIDGYLYIESSGNKNWRKNRRRNDDGSYGVDPNRNYPYKWGYDDINSSSNPSAMNYRGKSPVSEPETEAMIDFIHDHTFRTWQNHHSDRDVLVIPFGYDYTVSLGQDSIIYYTMCQEQENEYGRFKKWGPSYIAYDGFALNGGTEDWSWSDSATYRIYCIITELGSAMWESDAAAKVTAEKMLGADMYMIKCAGFYPLLKSIEIQDDGAGCNSDGILNPGETVKLLAEIENKSVVDTTQNVKGQLSSSYQHIDMKDAEADYGSIKQLETFENSTSDPFEFKCGSQAQEGDWAKFDLKITWTMNSVNFEKTLPCSTRVGSYVGVIHQYQIPGLEGGIRIVQSPNNRSISIKLVIPSEHLVNCINDHLEIGIYNAEGRELRRIDHSVNEQSNVIDWDMTDNSGINIPEGVYFIRVSFNGFNATGKFIILQ